MPPFISRRLSPVVVGACRAVHDAIPLPEAGPVSDADLTLAEVLAGQARTLVASVEATAPGTMARVRRGEPCGD